MEYTTLNNEVKIPIVGFGVYQIPVDQTVEAVTTALNNGYRLIDTAEYYRNEKEVGEAIRQSGIPRDQIFVTTKMPPQANYQEAAKRIDESLKALNIDYIDLMLIHWPGQANVENYQAMEDAVKTGKLRSIGLSSFYGRDYQEILEKCDIVPVVDQNETHVFRQQSEFQKVLEKNGTKLESWSPLAEGRHGIFQNATLNQIAQSHQKTVAQIVLRYLTQRGIIVIPKSIHADRIAENINLFDFKLTDAEMNQIAGLDTEKSIFGWY